MRADYSRFRALGAEIITVTRHDAATMREYWAKERLPFLGISDTEGALAKRYGQQWKLHKLGRMPAQFVIDCEGRVVYAHYGSSMADIPGNEEMLALMRALPGCPRAPASRPASGG